MACTPSVTGNSKRRKDLAFGEMLYACTQTAGRRSPLSKLFDRLSWPAITGELSYRDHTPQRRRATNYAPALTSSRAASWQLSRAAAKSPTCSSRWARTACSQRSASLTEMDTFAASTHLRVPSRYCSGPRHLSPEYGEQTKVRFRVRGRYRKEREDRPTRATSECARQGVMADVLGLLSPRPARPDW